MRVNLRAHFDGRVIVPEEPVELPTNKPLSVHVTEAPTESVNGSREARVTAVENLLARGISGLRIPDAALTRESIYEDR